MEIRGQKLTNKNNEVKIKQYLIYEKYIVLNKNKFFYHGRHITDIQHKIGEYPNGVLLDGYEGSGTLLKNYINKYGNDAFTMMVIDIFDNEKDMRDCEKEVVIIKNDKDPIAKFSLNLRGGGEGSIFSEETRQKMSESHLGKTQSEETRNKISQSISGENHYMHGKKHSEESKQKMSKARIGKYSGENHPMYGRKHSEETKERWSKIRKGVTASEETRQKMSKSQTGRKHSEESKQKMSKSKKRWKAPPSKIHQY